MNAYKATLKEEIEASIRTKPGVLTLYAVSVKVHHEQIRLFEIYRDAASYQAHLQSPHSFSARENCKHWLIITAQTPRFLTAVVTHPKHAIPLRNSSEQVGAIGPGMVWNSGKWFFYANAYHELGVKDRPEGDKLVLRVEKIF